MTWQLTAACSADGSAAGPAATPDAPQQAISFSPDVDATTAALADATRAAAGDTLQARATGMLLTVSAPQPIGPGVYRAPRSAEHSAAGGQSSSVTRGTQIDLQALKKMAENSPAGGFGVFAANTGDYTVGSGYVTVTPNFMYNQLVTWNNDQQLWQYTPRKYWPVAGTHCDYLSFYAYAPHIAQGDISSETAISGIPTQTEEGQPVITYQLVANQADQVDLLYASNINQRYDATQASVPLAFNHALAIFGGTITIQAGSDLIAWLRAIGNSTAVSFANDYADFTVTQISVTYHHYALQARLQLATGVWAAVSGAGSEKSSSLSVTGAKIYDGRRRSSYVWSDSEQGFMYIPAGDGSGNPGSIDITIKFRLTLNLANPSDPKTLAAAYDAPEGELTASLSLDPRATPMGSSRDLRINLTDGLPLMAATGDGSTLEFGIYDIPSQKYQDGNPVLPRPIVYDKKSGRLLRLGTDYTTEYSRNGSKTTSLAPATVTVKGAGAYSGYPDAVQSFQIED